MRAAMVLCMACLGVEASLARAGDAGDSLVRNRRRVADLLGTPVWGENLSGPLCGVYAACTAVQLVGMQADPRDFIATRYVGRCAGSSPEELVHVVEDSGAHARILARLSAFDLRLIDCPLIANVRVSPANERFNHWVVAVPCDTGFTIHDGLQEPYEVRTSEFLGIWSGVGISVTAEDRNPLVSIWLGRLCLLLAVLILAAVVLRNRALLIRASRRSVVRQACGLCGASLPFALVGNALFGDLPNHAKGVAVATAASTSGNYRMGTLDDARRAAVSEDMLLVDARRTEDYRLGTIRGAVNIPVTASTWSIGDYLESIDPGTPIVVFCQSASCPYDETVGAQLASLGFTDVTVCNEGWAEYREREHRSSGP